MGNDIFRGELQLNSNELSDLAALHLACLFEKRSCHNVTKLKLDGNNFTSKTGEYIGQALVDNPRYPIKTISFQGISLESIGLVRMMEAVNSNSCIKRLNIGTLTDDGLVALSELLKSNCTLEELIFQETADHQKFWTERGRGAFIETMRTSTCLKKVKMLYSREEETETDVEFKREISFYTQMKAKVAK